MSQKLHSPSSEYQVDKAQKMAAACPAMPAATRAISQFVTENMAQTGIAKSPRYQSTMTRPRRQARCRARPPTTSASQPYVGGRRDAVEEQHHLGAFAQYRDGDHDGERGKGLGALRTA